MFVWLLVLLIITNYLDRRGEEGTFSLMTDTQTSELEERLRADMQQAQRARDQVRLDTLRLALNAIHQEEVARTDRKHPQYGKPLTLADRLVVLEKQVKQRHEAAALFRQGNRPELAEKEEREATILQAYLPARLSPDEVTAEVRVIASKGEYAGWRATRATGDFDLRTFAIRAYPVGKIEGLRPGMSVYTDWARRAP
jgi:uncharacterized protein YqeY